MTEPGSGRRLRLLDRIDEVSREEWDALSRGDPEATPFTSWAFLHALEGSGSASPERGWRPLHVTLWRGDRLVAGAPGYLRGDGMADFSHDWGFADFASRIGLRFYPKFVIAVPFTPVGGRRILVASGEERAGCVSEIGAGALSVARELDLSGVQVLFPTQSEAAELARAGFATRLLFQFHWFNRGYESWEDWLADLGSKRRAMVRREARAPAEQGISIRSVPGEELRESSAAWAGEIHRFYRSTYRKHRWNPPLLTEAFFRAIIEVLTGNIEVVEARMEGRLAAGAFNVLSPTRLYGRYWGSHEEHRFLHFNVCFYHSIGECIRQGIEVFEGGMGGEHKLLRGFEPAPVYSSHLYLDPRLDRPIRAYLTREAEARKHEGRTREERARK